MILTQEELNNFSPEPTEVGTNRFSVGWYVETNFQIVVVFDKNNQKVVYKGKSKHRKDHRNYIESHYGKNNCDELKLVNPFIYDGF